MYAYLFQDNEESENYDLQELGGTKDSVKGETARIYSRLVTIHLEEHVLHEVPSPTTIVGLIQNACSILIHCQHVVVGVRRS